jgi:translocation and assembly module TamA
VVARGAADRKLMEQLLRIYGYYDSEVTQTVIGGAENAQAENSQPAAPAGMAAVRFDVQAGTRYRIGTVSTGDLAETRIEGEAMLRAAWMSPGDPLNLDTITAARSKIADALGDAGYPFAKVPTPSLTVDHARFEGDIDMPVESGGITCSGRSPATSRASSRRITWARSPVFARARCIGRIWWRICAARCWPPGWWARSASRRAAWLPQGDPGPEIQGAGKPGFRRWMWWFPAPQHTISGEMGYDTGEGYRIAAGWEHRNLFPPEGALKFRGILGTNEQLAGVTFRRSNFLGRDRVLTVDLYATMPR